MSPSDPKNPRLDRAAANIAARESGDPDELLSTSDLSEMTGLSISWFEIARCKGYGPPFKRLSHRAVRYKRSDVLAWLDERSFRCTSEYSQRVA